MPIEGRVCIVVDDGVATGSTLEASLRLVNRLGAAKVIAAVPVGPPDTIKRLSAAADEVVCPLQPRHFFAVGGWYETFDQVPDEDVAALLDP
jgi:predicted phosphoribosyltransferase